MWPGRFSSFLNDALFCAASSRDGRLGEVVGRRSATYPPAEVGRRRGRRSVVANEVGRLRRAGSPRPTEVGSDAVPGFTSFRRTRAATVAGLLRWDEAGSDAAPGFTSFGRTRVATVAGLLRWDVAGSEAALGLTSFRRSRVATVAGPLRSAVPGGPVALRRTSSGSGRLDPRRRATSIRIRQAGRRPPGYFGRALAAPLPRRRRIVLPAGGAVALRGAARAGPPRPPDPRWSSASGGRRRVRTTMRPRLLRAPSPKASLG